MRLFCEIDVNGLQFVFADADQNLRPGPLAVANREVVTLDLRR